MIGLLTTGRHDKAYLSLLKERLENSIYIQIDMPLSSSVILAAYNTINISYIIKDLSKISLLVVVGDRAETLSACTLATVMRIPILHIHGGEVTEGAIDNVIRNAISQLANIHCTAHHPATSNLRFMGVLGLVHTTGSPVIDLIRKCNFKRKPGKNVVLSYHPETLSDKPVLQQIEEAYHEAQKHLKEGGNIYYMGANPDASGALCNDFMGEKKDVEVITDLTPEQYWLLLSTSRCLVGNSSSGIIECPVLKVPFIEVGDRQEGRVRCSYGDGTAVDRIIGIIQGRGYT